LNSLKKQQFVPEMLQKMVEVLAVLLPRPERTTKPISPHNYGFSPFQNTQPSKEVAEEEQHHQIRP
jgi:hypothetical protein